MPDYWLNDGIYCADLGEAFIFLNLRSGRYLGLTRRQGRALADFVQEWPCKNVPQVADDEVRLDQVLIDEFVGEGLLTNDSRRRNMTLSVISMPATMGCIDLPKVPFNLKSGICRHFWAAYFSSRLRHHFFGMERSIEYLRKRKTLNEAVCSPWKDCDLSTLMGHFIRMRALAYTSHDKCVLDSLVLADFLLRNRVLPSVVIGVMTHPFKAHCWVQCGPVVLNGSVENITAFTPILVV